MYVLKIIKSIMVSGKILEPGKIFRTQNVQELITKGYARKLTQDEKRVILDGYVLYAEKLFNFKEGVRTVC